MQGPVALEFDHSKLKHRGNVISFDPGERPRTATKLRIRLHRCQRAATVGCILHQIRCIIFKKIFSSQPIFPVASGSIKNSSKGKASLRFSPRVNAYPSARLEALQPRLSE